jgi:hypothetical protein
MNTEEDNKKAKLLSWLKRSGIVVFFLFLGKGLLWVGFALWVWMGLSK